MSDVIDGIEAHIKGLRRYAMALVGNSSDADDLVQESLRRVLSYASTRDDILNWRAYLYTTLHNVRIDNFSTSKAGHHLPLEDFAEEISCPPSQHAHVEYQDLRRALALLPMDQREVLLLVGLEGLSYREVAEALSIPLGTVMSRLSRGRAALRRAMSPAGEEISGAGLHEAEAS
ncbi:MAG: sigma-70 family RNA polymerase sigma factor [Parvibaculum sp.]|uniref:sigma-70 family RNA polymerase sigma factor n=1 Tax=Parvibaculum sp. TaxID=2024848 RepID=UPI0025FEAA50|nr:sigma-70 family RNA polymerase sigma factor [Parvibaculum sp.]MCE9650949.1 sigma-70 family RNA polymerase sigma factor [Parvibaculum sp.]